jgi:hypothetical protein
MPSNQPRHLGSVAERSRRFELITGDREAGALNLDALRRIRADYLEMPGLRLTVAQGARLWNVSLDGCAALLDQLVAEGFLRLVGKNYSLT